jgi:hypothetical protein
MSRKFTIRLVLLMLVAVFSLVLFAADKSTRFTEETNTQNKEKEGDEKKCQSSESTTIWETISTHLLSAATR